MNISELENKIAVIKKGIDSPATPENQKELFKKTLVTLEKQLEDAKAKETKTEAPKKKRVKKERTPSVAEKKRGIVSKMDVSKDKASVTYKGKTYSIDECDDLFKAWNMKKKAAAKSSEKSESKPTTEKILDKSETTLKQVLADKSVKKKIKENPKQAKRELVKVEKTMRAFLDAVEEFLGKKIPESKVNKVFAFFKEIDLMEMGGALTYADVYEGNMAEFAKGGKISIKDIEWSNDDNKQLGIWLLTSVDGNSILSKSKNAIELEKNVMEYYNKKGSIAKMIWDEDEDEGLSWVTFSDLYNEVKMEYAKDGEIQMVNLGTGNMPLEDAIKMYEDKIKAQGRVTNERDEDILKQLKAMRNKMAHGGGVEDVSKSLYVSELYDGDGNLLGYTIRDKFNVSGKYTLSSKKERAEENRQYLIDNPKKLAYYRKNEYAKGGGVGISHYKVGDAVFVDYMDAVNYCDENNLPYSKIIKKKKYANGGSMSDDTPKIYVADLAAYNNGKLIGEWLDLSDYDSGDEVMDAITELLEKWSKESGEEREEFAIHDYENFDSSLYSEYMGEGDFDIIIKSYKLAKEKGVPTNVISYVMNQYSPDDIEDWFDSYYYGYFDSDTDFAYEYVDMIGGLENVGQDTLETYFDYEAFGRDLVINDFSEIDGYYFRTYKRGGSIKKYDLNKYIKNK